jgi:hypothetical protein
MTACELRETPDVEMFFYGELDAVDRLRVDRHVRACADCRQRLDDLHAIRAALAARPAVQAPPAGDWSGFMRRLDAELTRVAEASTVRAVEPSNPRTLEPATPATRGSWNVRTLVALAAMLALATFGVVMAMRSRPAPAVGVAVATPPASGAPAVPAPPARRDRALREGSLEHLERSKLVVLGLATRDPHARGQDWQYERALAGTLLTDTRLYRQAAIQDGAADVARVMRDLETVLLEASMSDRQDRAALERVQRLIAKRDLLVKMQVMAGPAGN